VPITPAILVHGGAGEWRDRYHADARAGCLAAARAGMAVLDGGGAALDAVQAAVRALEDDPVFNAGVGGVLNRDGAVEADAAIMDGATLGFGGIAAATGARHPIDLARAVLDDGEHVLLCGDGVWAFARERGFAPCDPAELVTERARERFEQARRERRGGVAADPGTVGAVAIDAAGRTAAATSTGGMSYKRPGRIGDTPLAGCGTYADDEGGAASATGHGEKIIRVATTLHCVNLLRGGMPAAEAARQAIDALARRVAGEGGLICVDSRGRLGAAHNTPAMAWGAARAGGTAVADITMGGTSEVLANAMPVTHK
jgi:beta-aspartyl-peptidase (threonine type)